MAVKNKKDEINEEKIKKEPSSFAMKKYPRIQTAEGWKRSQLLRRTARVTHKTKATKS